MATIVNQPQARRPKAADAVLKTRERLVKEGVLSVAQSKLIRVLDLAEAEE
jgi:hypothetical protein